MEVVSLLAVFVISLITLSYIIVIFRDKRNKLKPPPGSSGWPIIGETMEYLGKARKGFPEKFISDRVHKHSSNIFRTSLYGQNMIMFGSAEGNKMVFSGENKLVKSWWPKNFDKIFADGDKTTPSFEALRLHRVVSAFVRPNSLRQFVEAMDSATQHHFKADWPTCFDREPNNNNNTGSSVVKVHPLARKYTFSMACRVFFSLDDQKTIARLEDQIHCLAPGFISLHINLPGTKFYRAVQASNEIRREIAKIVVKRRSLTAEETPTTSDILSLLLHETYTNGELLMETDIANKLYGALVAAYDSISSTLVTIMSFLADLPHVYDAVFQEQMEIANGKSAGELLNWEDIQKMKYSWRVACEALRLLPPAMGTFREVIKDFVYQGFIIPKGFKLHWNAFATHKNPKYFPEPEKFDPSRFDGDGPMPFSYVPFGGGPRMCPGKEYSRLIILVFMHNLVKYYKWEKEFPNEKITYNPILEPEHGLPVRLYPRT